jgi:hypothetical protein
MAAGSRARTEQFEAAGLDAVLTAKAMKGEYHDWYLADA